MKKYRIPALLLSLVLMLNLLALPAAALEEPELQCTNAILVDANYGEVLYAKKADEKAYPASITKVMTALLVLEAMDSGKLTREQQITAGPTALQDMSPKASTANLKPGDTLTVEQLLYCLLLPSANEAGNILAVAVDGSIEAFVEHMNTRAAELGCKGTHFVNPHGLHDPDHYTTAYDISLYMTEALKHELFRTIIHTATYVLPATAHQGEQTFYNTNALISNFHYSGYVYDKCIGGKTGTTDEAGKCLVAAAESGDTLLISVILGSGVVDPNGAKRQGQFTESTKLLKWGFDNFRRVVISQGSDPVDKVAVTLSRQADEVMVKPKGEVVRTLPKDLDPSLIETTIHLNSDTVEAPVEEGQVLGTMTLSYEGTDYGSLDLVAVTSVERSELLYKKAQVAAFFQNFGVRVIAVIVLILVIAVLLKIFVFRKERRYGARVMSRGRRNYRGGRR